MPNKTFRITIHSSTKLNGEHCRSENEIVNILYFVRIQNSIYDVIKNNTNCSPHFKCGTWYMLYPHLYVFKVDFYYNKFLSKVADEQNRGRLKIRFFRKLIL